MAVDDINAGGGIHGCNIELIMKDDCNDPATAVKVDGELIRENVAAIIGHIHSPTTIAAVPIINKAKMVMISPIAATSRLTGIDDYFFRIDPPALGKSILQAQYAYRLGLRKMTGIYDDSFIPEYRGLTEKIHNEGAAIVMQIVHGGSNSAYMVNERRVIAPSGVENIAMKTTHMHFNSLDILTPCLRITCSEPALISVNRPGR